jgi:SET domain-containing protein
VTSRPHVIRRQSNIAGSGVFAGHSIAKNTRIVEYKGQLISEAEVLRRAARIAT